MPNAREAVPRSAVMYDSAGASRYATSARYDADTFAGPEHMHPNRYRVVPQSQVPSYQLPSFELY